MARFNLFFLALFFCGSVVSKAQCSGTATAATSGNWNAGPPASRATWTYSGGATSPNNACLIIIPNGISVTINNNQTFIGSVEVNGTLTLNNQLNLGSTAGCGLTLKIFGSGLLAGAGSNDRLIICGTTVVSGQPVPPPGAIDWPADGSFSAGDLGGSGGGFGETGVLPVELLFFKISSIPDSGYPYLEWATASELNFDYFLLERSFTGLDFYELDKVPGHGNTTERHDYFFVDDQPSIGRMYYRLTAVDFDGLTETFDILTFSYKGERKATVYPNPNSNGLLSILLNFTPIEEVKIVISNLNGKEKGTFTMSTNKASFNLNLRSGTYLVSINSKEFNQTQRIIIE